MTTSPHHDRADLTGAQLPVRIELRRDPATGGLDGAWWPRSRSFRLEASALIDHFDAVGRPVHRVLVSRPDWDDVVVDDKGLRRVWADRGPVKVGSFPGDDTHCVVLTMAGGRRLTITVVPPQMSPHEALRAMQAAVA